MQAGRAIAQGAVVAALMALALLWPAVAWASAPDLLTQSPEDGAAGAEAGRLGVPRGIATNPSIPGDVYVAGGENERIDEFTPWGEFVRAWGWGVIDGSSEFQVCTAETGCQEGNPGDNVGQFNAPEAITVDSAGDIYVMEAENHRVQKFDSKGNFLLMFGGEVNKTTKANVCTKADLEGGDVCGAGKAGIAAGEFGLGFPSYFNVLTTSPVTGTIFIGEGKARIQAFNPNGSFKEEIKEGCLAGKFVRAIASDSAGDLYVSFSEGTEVRKLKPTGPVGQCLAEPQFAADRVSALAVDPLEGRLFASVQGDGGEPARILEFDASGKCLNCGEEGEGGKPGFDRSAEIRSVAVGAACGPTDIYVGHVAPSQAFLRIFGEPPDVEKCKPPKRPPEISTQYTIAAETTQATVQAEINPNFFPDTRYYLEYGTGTCASGGCPSKKPLPPGSILTPKTTKSQVKSAAISLEGLQPATTYNYRFVAASGFVSDEPTNGPVWGVDPDGPEGPGEASFEEGEEGSFRTFAKPQAVLCPNEAFRAGASALLPDCRAYELVSPLEKGSADIIARPEFTTELPATLDQSSVDGEKLAYGTYRSFGGAPSAPFTSQYVAARGESGWVSHPISPPRERVTVEIGPQIDTELKALSPDLCESWWRTMAEPEPPLDADAVPHYPNLYQGQDEECGGTAWEALTTVKPPNQSAVQYTGLELQGRSGDGSTAIYLATDSLPGSGAPEQAPVCAEKGTCAAKLYYRSAGEAPPHYACVLPDGSALEASCTAGSTNKIGSGPRMGNMQGAISADGGRVFWSAFSGLPGPGPIYMREHPGAAETASKDGEGECVPDPVLACTIAVSEEAEELSGGSSRFWAAATDGSRAIFTSGKDLYSFEVATQATTLIAHKSLGVVGVSADGQRVYFVSEEACGGAGVKGDRNLYLYEAGEECGQMAFVAALASADVNPEPQRGSYSAVAIEPSLRATRVTPDGLGAAFMSFGQPTGYDNTDRRTGEADAEVYLYDATANGGEGELRCASCNPSGARPVGVDLNPVPDVEFWAAGAIPGWENNLYAARALSEDGGRLFFESSDALTPRDTNGLVDVYQWEAAGTGGCGEEAPSFSPLNGGCVDLVSSGQASQATRFHDASPEGGDVFFSTLESLLGQDFDLIDIYDARVGGGLPEPPPPPLECEGENCQHPAAPPAYITPSSALSDGPGNLSEKPPKKACPKGKVKKGGKCVKKKKAKAKKQRQGRHHRGAGR